MNEITKELLDLKIKETETSMFSWVNCASSDKEKSDQFALEDCRKLSQLKETQRILELIGDIPYYQIRNALHKHGMIE